MSDDYWDAPLESERLFNEQTIAEFRANEGRVGGQFEGFTLLLLTCTGAKTGAERATPVGYSDIDNKIYIVGSTAGRGKNPGWGANIRANPKVRVEIGSDAVFPPPRSNCHARSAIAYSTSSSSGHRASLATRGPPTTE